MKVYGKCDKCSHEIVFHTTAQTRVELAMQHDEHILLTCNNCRFEKKFHVNNIYTKPSIFLHLIAGLVFLIGTPLLFILIFPILSKSNINNYVVYAIGGILIVPFYIYKILKQQDQRRVNSFNRYKLKEPQFPKVSRLSGTRKKLP